MWQRKLRIRARTGDDKRAGRGLGRRRFQRRRNRALLAPDKSLLKRQRRE